MSRSDEGVSCSTCSRTFATAKALASHLKVHAPGVECPICKEQVRYLGPHMSKDHADDPLVQLEQLVSALVAEVRALREENSQLRAAKD